MQRLKIIFLVVSFCVLVFCSVRFFFNYNRSIGITETRTPANIEDDIYDVIFQRICIAMELPIILSFLYQTITT